MRTTEQQWLTAVGNYFDQLIPLLAPLQYSNGGPIINFQIEDDTDLPINLSLTHGYYSWLLEALRARGITTLVNTLAAPYPWQIMRASTPGAWLALEFNYDFDSHIAFDVFRVFYPTGPIMVMETYPVNSEDLEGVLPHQTLDAQLFANAVAEMLARNASVSIYPIQGGTNFGFTNGANHPGGPINSAGYTAISTSYDYDAPISECGDPTEKFFALRDVFSNYVDLPAGPPPLPTPKGAYGTINLSQYSPFWDALPYFKSINATEPIGMEALNQAYGYVLYTTTIEALTTNATMNVSFIQDKAQVYLDQVYQGTIGWDLPGAPTSLTLNPTTSSASTSVLSILVENKGRPCAQLGPVDGLSWAKKGIYGNVTLNGQVLLNWTMHSVPLDATPSQMPLNWQTYSQPLGQQPIFYRGTFNIPDATPLRTYFLTNGWGHGVAFINGFNLGRFTEQGPQMALYVPAATLRSGMNELVLFETDSPAQPPPFRSFSSVPMPYWL